MSHFELQVLNLLHDMKIIKSDFFRDDYQLSLNILDSTPVHLRKRCIETMIQQQLVFQEGDYIGLTPTGGIHWENVFEVDWNLYYESYFYVLDDNDLLDYYLYATTQETLKKVIVNHHEIFKHVEIKVAYDWQPIYWKKPMSGFFITQRTYKEPDLLNCLPSYQTKNFLLS